MPTASAIIPAAGRGERFEVGGPSSGPGRAKAFALLAGQPVLAHTLARFAAVEAVTEAVVAVPQETLDWARATFGDALAPGRRLIFVAGGSDRTDSVARAMEATDAGTELVAVHDAVRPLIRPAVIEEALRVAIECGAAVVGRPIDHTIKRLRDGPCSTGSRWDRRVDRTISREGLWLAQTPQVFRREIITGAYARRNNLVGHLTDDAQLVEALGHEVAMVGGDAANLKITTPQDLRLCEALLAGGWPFEDREG